MGNVSEPNDIGAGSAAVPTDRDPVTGHFLKGNKATPRKPRDQSSHVFKQWLRRFLEEPGVKAEIRKKVTRDLKGDGPATFAIRMIAYAHGEPRHVIEHELHDRIDELAREAGIDPKELLAATEQLLAN